MHVHVQIKVTLYVYGKYNANKIVLEKSLVFKMLGFVTKLSESLCHESKGSYGYFAHFEA